MGKRPFDVIDRDEKTRILQRVCENGADEIFAEAALHHGVGACEEEE
jgi:hypothetical protein